MKITILGAGRVGGSVAENLVGETNDITVVDSDPERLKYLQDRFDLRTVCGNAAEPRVLRQAGLEDAEMLLAVTPSDAVNMVACQLAKTMFNVPTKIARIRSTDFRHHDPDFLSQHFGVDFAISPEDILTQRLRQLLEYPEALQVLDFADGRARMVAMRARQGGLLVGCPLCDLPKHLPAVDIRVAAIYRDNRAIFPDGDTVVAENDEVFFIAPAEQIRLVARELRNIDRSVRRVMIAGGGNVGYRLARTIENDFQVKLIEANPARAEWLAQKLQKTLVLRGEATDEDLLDDENVGEMDVFLARQITQPLRSKRRQNQLETAPRIIGQPFAVGQQRQQFWHRIAATLFAGGHGHGLPVGDLLVGALALELEHAALGHQRGDAGHAQFGGFFDQPVHALVGGDARHQVDGAGCLAFDGVVGAHLHAHVAAAHAQHGGLEFTARAVGPAVKEGDAIARLQTQHLHVARCARGQVDFGTGGQVSGAVEAGHLLLLS